MFSTTRPFCPIRPFLALLLLLSLGSVAVAAEVLTFGRDILPILGRHCVNCHRAGQVAPMSLTTYDEARPWAKSIREQVAARRMPPWPAAPKVREYENDRSLSERDIKKILAWVDADAPQGEAETLPVPIFDDEVWQLGVPDVLLEMPRPYAIAATGEDEYRCFVLDPKQTENRWVSGVEIKPGNRKIDHHVALYLDVSGALARKDKGDGYSCFGSPGGLALLFSAWVPGLDPKTHPAGIGQKLPAGSRIVMQVHYHKNGAEQSDQTRVGLHFADTPVTHAMQNRFALQLDLNIPPDEANYRALADAPIRTPITLHSVMPHMHLLGRSITMAAELPDGTRVGLVDIPAWDFNWQLEYVFAEPLKLPAGSKITVDATFDNSADNPLRPMPPRAVTFGEKTDEEMLVGLFYFTEDEKPIVKAE